MQRWVCLAGLLLLWVLRVVPRDVCRGTPSAEGLGQKLQSTRLPELPGPFHSSFKTSLCKWKQDWVFPHQFNIGNCKFSITWGDCIPCSLFNCSSCFQQQLMVTMDLCLRVWRCLQWRKAQRQRWTALAPAGSCKWNTAAKQREEGGGMHKEELSCKESSTPTLLSLSQLGNRAPFVMTQKPHSQLPAHHIQSPVAGMWKDL